MDKQEIVFQFPTEEKRPDRTEAFLMYGHVLSHISCKVRPRTCHEVRQGSRGIALSLTSALDGGWWSKPRPCCFTPEQDKRYPFYRRLGGPQGRTGRVRKISPTPGFNPRTVQPVASCCTEYAMLCYPHS
jgi:hypothetical protein